MVRHRALVIVFNGRIGVSLLQMAIFTLFFMPVAYFASVYMYHQRY